MSRCSNNLGTTVGDAVFTDLDYADDAVLFTQHSGRWQADLKRSDETATTMGLHTSWEKTVGIRPKSNHQLTAVANHNSLCYLIRDRSPLVLAVGCLLRSSSDVVMS